MGITSLCCIVSLRFSKIKGLQKKQNFLDFYEQPPRYRGGAGHTNRGGRSVLYGGFKRAADIVISSLLLLLFSPALFMIAWLVRWDSPGRIVFRQERIGWQGRPFFIYKFRTMYVDAPPNAASSERETTAPYITPVGRWLRRSSMDELPQLWNVLKGDMSLVGPRPVIAAERELLRLRRQNGALQVRPGITGLAQVRGRGKLTPAEKARYDAQYVRQMSLWLDIRILLMTRRCLFHGG